MEDKTIYFYLPGIVENLEPNLLLIRRMEDFPDHFYDNVKIGGIYGCPPGAKWNGGRYVDGYVKIEDIKKLSIYADACKIPHRFTWTNPCLTEEDLDDPYCNYTMDAFNNGVNEVLVNSDLMEKYIREHYPKYSIISSTTKRITDIDALNKELEKDYKLVVIDYDFNNKWDLLDKIEHKEKCEILINPICNPNCPFRKRHYEIIGKMQRGDMSDRDEHVEGCNAQNRIYTDVMKLPTFISREDLYGKYYKAGFRHFKIEGRACSPMRPLYWCLYYLVKPEYLDEERGWLELGLDTRMMHPNIPIHFD